MKVLLLFLALILCTAGVTWAAPVDFATNATFSCNGVSGCNDGGGGQNFVTITVNGEVLTLLYNAVPPVRTIGVTPNGGTTGTNFGSIDVSCNCLGGLDATFNLAGITLSMTITQGPRPFGPATTTGFTGTVTGSLDFIGGIFGGSSDVGFVPLVNSLTLGPDTLNYNITGSPYGISIGNVTSLQGSVGWVQAAAVPEPGTLGLIGLGLAGLGLVSRRRRRA